MDLKGKKILVTGADGFIGSHLTEELVRRGHDVRAFVLYNSFNSWGWLDSSPPEIRRSLDVFAGDVRDPHGVQAAMKGCDVVLHLAALIAIPYSYHSPDAYVDTNVRGTLNIVQAARALGVAKVVHTSTSEVYGTARFVPITEQHPLQGQSPYSATKIGADQIAMSFYSSFGTPVAILRPFNTYGPRQSARAVIPTIITQIATGKRTIRLGAVHPTRDFNFVADTVRGFIATAEADAAVGQVINVGSDYEVSIGDTARLIAEVMGAEIAIECESARLRPEKSEVERLWASNARARELLGWQPGYGGLEGFKRGLRETAEWFSRPEHLARYKADIYNLLAMQDALDLDALLAALGAVLPKERRPLGLHEPEFAGHEWEYVKECIDTGWVSSVGKFVDRFEATLAEATGVRRAVACVNGTCALHVALMLCGVQANDEVLIPTLTFVATANAIAYCGAVPHFVDSDLATLGVDPRALADYLAETLEPGPDGPRNRRTGRRVRALMPVHIFGHPVDLDPLTELCNRHGLRLIEDATEALGSSYKGRSAGNFGDLAVLSFNGNKIVTTGGGGALLTNDEALGRRAKHLTTTAKKAHSWAFVHDEVGYNYRLPNLNAALGCAQLERLPSFLERKRALAARYEAALASVPGVSFFHEPPHGRSNYWLNALLLDRASAGRRDEVLERTNAEGIGTRPAWTLMHRLPMYTQAPRMPTPVAEDIEARLVNLPSSAFLA